jgi:hypothetical protein
MSLIPDRPVTFSEDDFTTARTRVRAARSTVLANERAAEAHRALGKQIADRTDTDGPHSARCDGP